MSLATEKLKARIKSILKKDLDRVETILQENISSQVDLISDVGRHITTAGGKRLRPILVLLAARLAGYSGDRVVNLAAVVELIHTTTLLHDDVIDQATFRRGIASTNTEFGNKASVLVGDYLYSQGFYRMVDDGDLRIIAILTEATVMMAEGEVRQLRMSRNISLDEDEYLMVVDRKTARLIAACCRIGAILGEGGREMEEALESYGYHLGLAYQITDDSLDYIADPEILGKALGADLREGKITLPLIYLLKRVGSAEADRIRQVISTPEPSPAEIDWVMELIKRQGTAEDALKTAAGYADRARAFLSIFPDVEERHLLEGVTEFATHRDS